MQSVVRFYNIFSMAQSCDPCFKAVKLQKPEFKKKLATTSDTDTPNTNPTSPTKDCSQMMSVTFFCSCNSNRGVHSYYYKGRFSFKIAATNSTKI